MPKLPHRFFFFNSQPRGSSKHVIFDAVFQETSGQFSGCRLQKICGIWGYFEAWGYRSLRTIFLKKSFFLFWYFNQNLMDFLHEFYKKITSRYFYIPKLQNYSNMLNIFLYPHPENRPEWPPTVNKIRRFVFGILY